MILLKNKQYYYWNEKSVSPWIKYNSEMNYKFENVNKILFENISLKKNQSILDIGCGAGQTSYTAKKKVGVNGTITAVDISTPLLNLFKKKYKNIKNLVCLKKDLQKTGFKKNIFDHAISRFGIMFFEYPLRAFTHTNQALKKDGSFTFVCWRNFRYNQFFTIPAYSVKKKTKIDLPESNNTPGPFSLKDKQYIKTLLKQSGFRKITIENIITKLKISKIKTEIDIMMKIGVGARMIRESKIDRNTCDVIKRDISNKLQKLFKNQNYYNAHIYRVTAIK
ncbi:class I SAM-dependent methyltransferase [Alphaproteobacteria bacterium]|nr:class I SAM-dependent methyltransferase [Alphaproteobacteria bacterium]